MGLGGSDAIETCVFGQALAVVLTRVRSIRVPFMVVVGDEDLMRGESWRIAAYCVGRSEAVLCARVNCVLRVAVFGAQHHCAARCAVCFFHLIIFMWVRPVCYPRIIEQIVEWYGVCLCVPRCSCCVLL